MLKILYNITFLILLYFIFKNIYDIFKFNINIKISTYKCKKTILADTEIPNNSKKYIINNLEKNIDNYILFRKNEKNLDVFVNNILLYFDIKDVISVVKNQEVLINDMISDFNSAKKELKILKRKYPNETNKYLLQFNNDLKYYLINYIDNIKNLITNLKDDIEQNEYNNITKIINKIETYKKAYYIDINSVYYVKNLINTANKNIINYENDIKKENGSLYNKLYNKIKKHNTSDYTIENWNIVNKEINKYIKNKSFNSDIVTNSNTLINIITLLNKIDILSNADIEKNNL